VAFESSIAPLFAGNVRTMFRHYPIDQSCNARSAVTMHPHACQGAVLAEAARLVAGSDGFWRMHDYLFKNRETLAAGTMTPELVAGAIGLDPAALAQAMTDPRVKARISDDIEQARLIELRGTPTILVQSRAVDTVAAGEMAFWDKLADVYWKSINTPRPESTRMRPAPTPSTPNPTAAP
jgi:predicted DsbA family dithiol-disulfide isomerase